MKLFLSLSLLLLSISSFATAYGNASVTISGHQLPCNPVSELGKEALWLSKKAAEKKADHECNNKSPGSQSIGIQRVLIKKILCNEEERLEGKFAAVYLCD